MGVGTIKVEPHVEKLPDRSRCQAVAARLVPRIGLLLDENDLEPASRQPVGGGGTSRATSDDEHLGGGHRHDPEDYLIADANPGT
jgi:hypothetical protein